MTGPHDGRSDPSTRPPDGLLRVEGDPQVHHYHEVVGALSRVEAASTGHQGRGGSTNRGADSGPGARLGLEKPFAGKDLYPLSKADRPTP